MIRQFKKEEAHDYWKYPDQHNNPEKYLMGLDRSAILFRYIKKYCKKEDKILEIGCNVGRNLNYLYNRGYKNLTGIEINSDALILMDEAYPLMLNNITIYNNAIEDIINIFDENHFDVIYTMAVLEHICVESDWIFEKMANITKKYLILYEDEFNTSLRHFPRDYRYEFMPFGFKELESGLVFNIYTIRILIDEKHKS